MTEKLNEAVASILKDKSQRQALAEMLVEYIDPNHIAVDFASMLLNTRRLNAGDSLIKRVRKGIKTYTFVPGTNHLASQITVSERVNYVLDGIITKVSFSEWDLANGTIGTVESIRMEMLAKLRDAVQNKVFNALSTVWSAVNTPSNYTTVGGPITATVLEDAINTVTSVTGGVRAVVGIRSLMNPITKFGAFVDNGAVSPAYEGVPSQMEEVVQMGKLGKFMGAPLVYLNQIWDNPEDYNALLPTDKILVIGENVGDLVIYGDVMSKEYTDPRPTPSEWVLENWQQMGMLIDNAQGIYVIDGLTV